MRDLDRFSDDQRSPGLPGRIRFITSVVASLALCAVVGRVEMAASPLALLAAPVLATPVLILILGVPIRRARLRQLLVSGRYRDAGDGGQLALPGLRYIRLRTGQVRGLARCYRAGGRAVVLVHEKLLTQPDLVSFLVVHELVHLARNDSALRPAVLSSLFACWASAVLIWPSAIAWVPLVLVIVAVFNWTMELECDRLAARSVGVERAQRALSVLVAIHGRMRRGRLQTMRSLLSYPPPIRRLAAVRMVKTAPCSSPQQETSPERGGGHGRDAGQDG